MWQDQASLGPGDLGDLGDFDWLGCFVLVLDLVVVVVVVVVAAAIAAEIGLPSPSQLARDPDLKMASRRAAVCYLYTQRLRAGIYFFFDRFSTEIYTGVSAGCIFDKPGAVVALERQPQDRNLLAGLIVLYSALRQQGNLVSSIERRVNI